MNMPAACLVAFLVQSAIVGSAALIAGRMSRRAGPALRVSIYRAGVLAALALIIAGPGFRLLARPWLAFGPPQGSPFDQAIRPPSLPPVPAAFHSARKADESVRTNNELDLRKPAIATEPIGISDRLNAFAINPASLLTGIWLTGVILMLGLVAGGALWILRLGRSGGAASVDDLAKSLAAREGIKPVRLAMASGIRSAFAAGIGRPTVFLPGDFERTFDRAQMEAILSHELVHIRRRDGLWTLIARLGCAIAWPNPLMWLLARDLTLASEELCDQLVLGSGIEPSTYAGSLLKIAECTLVSPAARLAGSGVYTTKSHLSRRISIMLNKPFSVVSQVTARARFLVASTALATVLAACLLISTGHALGNSRLHDATPEATVTGLIDAFNRQDWRGVFSRVQDAKVDASVAAMSGRNNSMAPTLTVSITSVQTVGDSATLQVRLAPAPKSRMWGPRVNDEVHLRRIDGDWKIIDGGGSDSIFTETAEMARNPERLKLAGEKTKVLSNLKQIGLAVFMFLNDHNDKFSLSQTTLKAKLMPYLKTESVWLGPDGKPLDIRFNLGLAGRSSSSVEQPAITVMLTVGPRSRLQLWGGMTPLAFADGHVKFMKPDATESLYWK